MVIKNYLLLIFFILICSVARGEGVLEKYDQYKSDISIDDNNILIFTVDVGDIKTEQYIQSYKHNEAFLFPLGELSKIAHFQIDIDYESGAANGWLRSQKETFSLDLDKEKVMINGSKQGFNKNLILKYFDDIYIDESLYKEWFGISFIVDYSQMKVKIASSKPLPIEEQKKREEKHKRLVYRGNQLKAPHPRKKLSSDLVSPPFFDMTLGANLNKSPNNSSENYNYSVLSQSDLLHMTQRTFISGNKNEDLASLRFSLNKIDVDGNLLGKMRANRVSLGDIDVFSKPLVVTGGVGRGVSISNYDLNRSAVFNTRTFMGTLEPGWTVELYQNDVLLDFKTTEQDGRYQFLDIPIYYGNNVYKLVAYGPQGQVKEEVFNNLIDDSVIQKGRWQYNISVDQKNQTIFGIDEKNRPLRHPKGERILLDTEYGINDKVTLGLDYARTPLEDGKTHDYASTSIRTTYGGMFSYADFTYDIEDKGYVLDLGNLSQIGNTNLRLNYQKHSNFTSEFFNSPESRRDYLVQADLFGTSKYLPFSNNYRFLGERIKFENGRIENRLQNTLTASFGGIRYTNDLQWVEREQNGDKTDSALGDFSVRGRYGKNLIRSNLLYSIAPETQLTAALLSVQHRFNRDLNIQTDINQSFIGNEQTTFSTSLNQRFKHFILSANASANTEDQYNLGFQLSFGLGFDPISKKPVVRRDGMATRRAITPIAYIDSNDNDIYDLDEDEVAEEVIFKTNASKYQYTDSGLITGLDPFTPQNFEVDVAMLESPLWKAQEKGYAVTSPLGTAKILPIKVYKTIEIEGTAWLKQNGKEKYAKGMPLQLLEQNGNVIAETVTSSWDGYYAFTGIKPGIYIIDIDPEIREKNSIMLAKPMKLFVEKSDIYTGNDIILIKK